MTRHEIEKQLSGLQKFLKVFNNFALILIISVASCYLLALWLWLEQHTIPSIILASTGFFIFYLTHNRLIQLTCHYLKQDPHYEQIIQFVEKHSANKSTKDFITQLDKAIKVITKDA